LYLNCFSARAAPEAIDRVLPVPAESVGGTTVGSAWAVTIELTEELYIGAEMEKNGKKQNVKNETNSGETVTGLPDGSFSNQKCQFG
jgi:hypothetical protein